MMVSPWRIIRRAGLAGSLVALHLALVGMVEAFNKREIVQDTITLGQLLLLGVALGTAYYALRQLPEDRRLAREGWTVALGSVAVVGVVLALLALAVKPLNLRFMFQNASPELVRILTFHTPPPLGLLKLLIFFLIGGALTAGFLRLPAPWNRVLGYAAIATLVMGVLRAILAPLLPDFIVDPIYTPSGLTRLGAVILLVLWTLIFYTWPRWKPQVQRLQQTHVPILPRRRISLPVLLGLLVLFLLPAVLRERGSYLFEVLDMVGIYVVMGLGLNIVVGYAGLLDLGYVAFFAIGAYTMAVLTTPENLPLVRHFLAEPMTFWEVLPIVVVISLIAGILLGVPVLKTHGDYLAIITLGFGEIIRLLVISDLLKPILGGAQGITGVARPTFFGRFVINESWEYFYFIVIVIGIGLYVSIRLRDSRIGRAWKAIREDEDVAKAMGIDHVATKLSAFATGAVLAGLAGALFSSRLYSIAPHSFNVLISINVLCLLIVGGMGSLPGVVVGALALVGLPELLREFAEFRLLVYGAALVIMMLYKPEGLWPERARVSAIAREVFGDRLKSLKVE